MSNKSMHSKRVALFKYHCGGYISTVQLKSYNGKLLPEFKTLAERGPFRIEIHTDTEADALQAHHASRRMLQKPPLESVKLSLLAATRARQKAKDIQAEIEHEFSMKFRAELTEKNISVCTEIDLRQKPYWQKEANNEQPNNRR